LLLQLTAIGIFIAVFAVENKRKVHLLIQASTIPTPHAAANIMMPRCTLRRVATAKTAMKIPMAVNWRSKVQA